MVTVGTALVVQHESRRRQIVLQHHEHFPFVAVGIVDPRFVLQGVTAVGLHLISRYTGETYLSRRI